MQRLRWPAALACCLVACGWAVLILMAPRLATARDVGARLSAASYLVGGLVCHQRSARSFHAAEGQLPVCARCTGLYLGGAGGLLLGLLLPALRVREPLATLAGVRGWRYVIALAAIPMLATAALEWTGLHAGSNVMRAVASLPIAWTAGAFVAESLSFRVTL